jgi:hypothetical protein
MALCLQVACCLAQPNSSLPPWNDAPPSTLTESIALLPPPDAPTLITRVTSTNQHGGHSRTFTFDSAPSLASSTPTSTKRPLPWSRIPSALQSTFLPIGFPHTTPTGYLQYCLWSGTQDLSTQLRSVLATQRVLEGVGVGRAGATAVSAVWNFIIRDGCGMAASLLFTAWAARRFRSDIKRWRIVADVLIDVGITLEMVAVHLPTTWFLPLISLASMCKAMCGVAAGSTGGALAVHWAQGSDISDIQAKFGAQIIVTGSLGLVFAACLTRFLAQVDRRHLWMLYVALTALHLYANTRCMKLVAFTTLNNARMDMLLIRWFRDPTQALPSPAELSNKEPLLFLPRRSKLQAVPIHYGVSFEEFSKQSIHPPKQLQTMLSSSSSTTYWITEGQSRSNKPCVLVALSSQASPVDQAKAYFEAVVLGRQLRQSQSHLGDENGAQFVERSWSQFAQQCAVAGWTVHGTELRNQGFSLSVQ